MIKLKNFLKLLVIICLPLQILACASTSSKKPTPIDPDKAHATHIQLGMKYLQAGSREHARRQFRAAQELKKRSADAFNGMALIHEMNGEVDLAEENFKKAEKNQNKGNAAQIAFTFGKFLMSQKRHEEACVKFESAGKDLDYRQRSVALLWAGKCALVTGNKERAAAAYKHALNLNNRLTAAMLELALLHFDRREYAESKDYLDRFSARAPHTAQSLWLGIKIERIFGNQDKEASYGIALKNLHGYSKEYLMYKDLLAGKISIDDVQTETIEEEPVQ